MTDANDPCDPISLPANVSTAVQSELLPGERVIWCGQVKAGAALRFLCVNSAWIPLLIVAAFVAALLCLAQGHFWARVVADELLRPLALGLAAVFFWAGLVLWGWKEVRSIAYVLTDRRAFSLRTWPWRSLTGTLPGCAFWVTRKSRPRGAANVLIRSWRDDQCRRLTTVAFMLVDDIAGLRAALAAATGTPRQGGPGGDLFRAVAIATKPQAWKSVLLLCLGLVCLAKQIRDDNIPAGMLDWTVIGPLGLGALGATVFAFRHLRWRRAFATAPGAAENAMGEQTHDR